MPKKVEFTEAQHKWLMKVGEKKSVRQLVIGLKEKFGMKRISPHTVKRHLKENVIIKKEAQLGKADPIYVGLLYYENGLTIGEVAAIVGKAPGTVSDIINRTDVKRKFLLTKIYRNHKDKILEIKQFELLEKLTAAKLRAMSGKELVDSITKLEDKIRVIRGEPTEIAGIEAIDMSLAELMEEEKRLNNIIDITPVEEEKGTSEEDKELTELDNEIKQLEGN